MFDVTRWDGMEGFEFNKKETMDVWGEQLDENEEETEIARLGTLK